MEYQPEQNEQSSLQERVWGDFEQLFEGEKKRKTVYLVESPDLLAMDLDTFASRDPDILLAMLGNHESEVTVMERLKMLGYWIAFKEIKQSTKSLQIKGDENAKFVEIQKKIDGVALNWLNHVIGTKDENIETSNWAQEQLGVLKFDLEKRQGKKYTNLQVLRGSKCNVGCKFCFTQRAEIDNVDTKGHLADVAEVNYNKGDVALQMLYARMAYGLDEILFTSYGDPLANAKREDDVENNPHISLNEEIRMAREVGFPQITLLSNCTGLFEKNIEKLSSEEKKRLGVDGTDRELTSDEINRLGKIRIDMLVSSGLTHLTISLHTMNPDTWKRLVNPRSGVTYEQMVEWVKYAGSVSGLTARST